MAPGSICKASEAGQRREPVEGATGTQFHWGALGDSIEQAQDHPKREHFYFILPSSLSLAKGYSWLRDGRAWVEDIKTLWHFWPVLNKG